MFLFFERGEITMEGVLERGLSNKQKVEIVYIDSEGRITQRFVRITVIREDTIFAYCYWRKQVRSFKRKNILSAYPVQARYASLT